MTYKEYKAHREARNHELQPRLDKVTERLITQESRLGWMFHRLRGSKKKGDQDRSLRVKTAKAELRGVIEKVRRVLEVPE